MEQAVVTCLDGLDLVTKQPPCAPRAGSGRLYPLDKFVEVSKQMGLPLNIGKSVVQFYNAKRIGRCSGHSAARSC